MIPKWKVPILTIKLKDKTIATIYVELLNNKDKILMKHDM